MTVLVVLALAAPVVILVALVLASWADTCAVPGCTNPLAFERNYRKVPSRGGKLLPVCDPCADAIDRQSILVDELGHDLGESAA